MRSARAPSELERLVAVANTCPTDPLHRWLVHSNRTGAWLTEALAWGRRQDAFDWGAEVRAESAAAHFDRRTTVVRPERPLGIALHRTGATRDGSSDRVGRLRPGSGPR